MDHLDITPARLAGTWHIVCSSFPLWQGDRRTGATFTYGPPAEAGAGPPRMTDDVAYRTRSGRERHILGVDTRLTARPGSVYRWRGRGVLAALSSEWEVREMGADDAWAVIVFSKSLVTPAGADVVVRADRIDDPAVIGEALGAGVRHEAPPVPEWRRA
ncbi:MULTISPECIES: hypothetical protein [unclassified Streptomyces]|uniref:hypothetical protein n=1 Tax=unclassified Streptomyces TaxID=2593676 RepID=UPI000DB964AB|nr:MULTISPECIES: hypothetical protein [unclassified Streptomyces]MYT74729.1 hypothetical protein [Streptomyces sp. SID8367]RAJ91715.1 hypothetical protein K377_00484 [Streptomyces sp. PsTaAH-137]